jgi:hypothetical protein
MERKEAELTSYMPPKNKEEQYAALTGNMSLTNKANRGKGYVIPMDKQAEIVKQLFLHQISRKQLASEMGITNQNLSKILLGRTSCSERYRNYLLKRLGVVL